MARLAKGGKVPIASRYNILHPSPPRGRSPLHGRIRKIRGENEHALAGGAARGGEHGTHALPGDQVWSVTAPEVEGTYSGDETSGSRAEPESTRSGATGSGGGRTLR